MSDELAELRRAAARYDSLVAAAELDVWRADGEGHLITDMPEWRMRTGQEEGTVEGEGWLEGVHPDHRARVAATWGAAVANRGVYECEYPIIGRDGSTRMVLARAAPLTEDGIVREWVGTTTDVTAQHEARARHDRMAELERTAVHKAEAANERVRLLAGVSRRLAEAGTSADAAVAVLLDAAVPRFGDWACVHLVDHGDVRLAGVRQVAEERDPALAARIRRDPVARAAPEGAAAAMRTGRPQHAVAADGGAGDISGADPIDAGSGEVPWSSTLSVPLVDKGLPIGAWTVARFAGEPHSPEDLELLDDLASRAAVAVRNAFLLERLRELARISAAVNAARDMDVALQIVTEAARRVIGAHQAVTSMTKGSDWQQSISAVSLSERYAAWRSFDGQPDGSGIYAVVAEEQRPMRCTQEELQSHPRWRGFGAWGDAHPPMRGWLAAPLTAPDGSNLGIIQLSDRYEGDFDEEDEATLSQLAEIAAAAIHRLELYQERAAIAEALQRPLSPPQHSELPGLEVAVRYRPYGEALEVGGDFYDVFEMAGGHWGVLLGDVCGKGPEAAAIGGVARQTVWASTRRKADVVESLEILNAAVARQDLDRFCTVVFASIFPGPPLTFEIGCGGHPKPVLVRQGGGVERVGGAGPLVGPFPHPTFATEQITLEPGDTLVFFTDGLVEGGGAYEVGEDELEQVVAALAGEGDVLSVVDGLVGFAEARSSGGVRDDLAVLAVRVPAEAVRIDLEARPEAAGAARRWVHQQLERLGRSDICEDVQAVVAELVTNAVIHAQTPARLVLREAGRGLRIEVVDEAPDRVPQTGGPGLVELGEGQDDPLEAETMTGRGLVLVAALTDAWGVETSEQDKTVWAELGTGRAPSIPLPPPAPGAEGGVPVRLAGVPARLVLMSAASVDDVVRELTVAQVAGLPHHDLGGLASRLLAATSLVRDPVRVAARRAVERHERLLDVMIEVPAQAVSSLHRFLILLEEVAEACEEGRLLSMAPRPEVRAYRHWFLAEIARQVAGEAPTPCPFPVVGPEDPDLVVATALADAAVATGPEPAAEGLSADVRHSLAVAGNADEVVAAALQEATPLGAASASLCLLEDDGLTVSLVAAVDYTTEVLAHWSSFAVSADLPASEVIRTGSPMYLRTRQEINHRFPVFTTTPTNGNEAIALLPVRRGCLVFGFPHQRSFGAPVRASLAALAAAADEALHRF